MANTSAFQAEDAGSIPVIPSAFLKPVALIQGFRLFAMLFGWGLSFLRTLKNSTGGFVWCMVASVLKNDNSRLLWSGWEQAMAED